MIKLTWDIVTKGRESVRGQLSKARRISFRRNEGRSFVSGKKAEIGHHGFDVTSFPMFAASAWNIWLMTKREHNAFHSWRGGTYVWCTPFHLYWWLYFHWYWWRGAALVGLFFVGVIWWVAR